MKNHPTTCTGSTLKTLVAEDKNEDGLIVVGFDGSVKIANPVACQIFGLQQEEVINQRFAKVFSQFEEFDEIVLDTVKNRSGVKQQAMSVQVGDAVRSCLVTTCYVTTDREGAPMAVSAVLAG